MFSLCMGLSLTWEKERYIDRHAYIYRERERERERVSDEWERERERVRTTEIWSYVTVFVTAMGCHYGEPLGSPRRVIGESLGSPWGANEGSWLVELKCHCEEPLGSPWGALGEPPLVPKGGGAANGVMYAVRTAVSPKSGIAGNVRRSWRALIILENHEATIHNNYNLTWNNGVSSVMI